MTTIAEAQSEISRQQQQIVKQREQIQRVRLPKQTRAELQRRGRAELVQRREQEKRLEGQKTEELRKIKKYEKEVLSPYQLQVTQAERQQAQQRAVYSKSISDLKIAQKLFKNAQEGKNPYIAMETPAVRKYYNQLQKGLDYSQELSQKRSELTAPQEIGKDSLVGYKNIITGDILYQSFRPKDIPKGYYPIAVSPTTLKELPQVEQLKLRLIQPEKFNVEDIPKYEPPTSILGGEPFNIWKIPLYTGKAIEASPSYQKAITLTKKRLPIVHKILTTPTPPIIEDITTSLTMFSFFSPAMSTGVFQKLKLKGKFEEIKKLNEKEADEVITRLRFKLEGKTLKDKTSGEKIEDIRKIFDKIKNAPKENQKELIKQSLNVFEESYGKENARLLLKDYLAQEGVSIQSSTIKTQNTKELIDFVTENIPQMKGVGQITGATTGSQSIFLADEKTIEKDEQFQAYTPLQAQITEQEQKTGLNLVSGLASSLGLKQTTEQAQPLKQLPKQKLAPKQELAIKQISLLKSISVQRTIPKQKGKQKQFIRYIQRAGKKPLKKGTIIPTKEELLSNKRLIRAIKKVGTEGVDIVVGLKIGKQKNIGENLPKWKALRKAQKYVDANIQASYKLKKTGKKAKGKDIEPFTPSFKFKGSKTNPLFQIERRFARLDHPREVSQLKVAKASKIKIPRNFFPKVKKKRKK